MDVTKHNLFTCIVLMVNYMRTFEWKRRFLYFTSIKVDFSGKINFSHSWSFSSVPFLNFWIINEFLMECNQIEKSFLNYFFKIFSMLYDLEKDSELWMKFFDCWNCKEFIVIEFFNVTWEKFEYHWLRMFLFCLMSEQQLKITELFKTIPKWVSCMKLHHLKSTTFSQQSVLFITIDKSVKKFLSNTSLVW